MPSSFASASAALVAAHLPRWAAHAVTQCRVCSLVALPVENGTYLTARSMTNASSPSTASAMWGSSRVGSGSRRSNAAA